MKNEITVRVKLQRAKLQRTVDEFIEEFAKLPVHEQARRDILKEYQKFVEKKSKQYGTR
jgi:translation initiation factor 2 beta subunit (eIF-2beta)/eIF-5